MELQDYLRVLRKRWRVISFVTLVVIALAAGVTMATTKMYAASTQFFVSTSGGDNVSALQQGNAFTQARVKSYSQLLESPKVLDPVIADLGLDLTAEQLATKVTSVIPVDTVIIDVTVTDTSAEQAARIAGSIARTFPETIEKIEQVQSRDPSPVKVTVTKGASVEPGPISPKPVRNISLGLVLGLLLGFGVALLRDLLDTSIRGERDLELVTDTTVVGGIGYDSDATAHPLIVQIDPRSQRAESFRSVRTNLQFIDVANPPKSIVVTSSVPEEGKSTTTANLALSIAETGQRVVVIEGDLRRPRLLDYLGLEGAVGLTDVLIGRVKVGDVLQPVGTSGVEVLGSGPVPPNPSELLGSSPMAELVRELESRYDYVLIDAPPLLPVTDAAVLSTVVDGALIVVGAGIVTKEQLGHAIAALDAVNGQVLGLIMNRVQAKDHASAYGSYRYHYLSHSDTRRSSRRAANAARARGEADAESRVETPVPAQAP
ncbi:MAG: polysaccharide biosynthesis tyrosine autokinase [Micrococcales bacterium]|nr:polysaccharide biosynthesis tyrosine autokinase [Micrococcales bacterium]